VGASFCQKPTFYKVFLQKNLQKVSHNENHWELGTSASLFTGEIFAKFRLQKYDFALYKGLLMKKKSKIANF
jgi:hypothetical protein